MNSNQLQNGNESQSEVQSRTQFRYDEIGSPVSKPQNQEIPVAQPYYENVTTVPAATEQLQEQPISSTRKEFTTPSFSIKTMFQYFAYHLLNIILGFTAFIVLVTLISLSFGLIPVLGFGLLLWRFTLDIQRFFVEIDVALFNYIIEDPDMKIKSSIPMTDGLYGISKDRYAYGLFYCSRMSVMATMYFLTVKLVISILSIVAVILIITGPFAMFAIGPLSLHATKFFCAQEHNNESIE